jgi:hypothetical protein
VTQMVYKHAISTVVPARRYRSRLSTRRIPERPRAVLVSLTVVRRRRRAPTSGPTRLRASSRARAPRSPSMRARARSPDPKTYVGSGKVDEIRERDARAQRRDGRLRQPLSAAQVRNLERALSEDSEAVLGLRPHRPHPQHLRAARAVPRRQAPGGARAPRAPVDAPGARVDPPRTPARRPRQDRRPGREADRTATAASSASA